MFLEVKEDWFPSVFPSKVLKFIRQFVIINEWSLFTNIEEMTNKYRHKYIRVYNISIYCMRYARQQYVRRACMYDMAWAIINNWNAAETIDNEIIVERNPDRKSNLNSEWDGKIIALSAQYNAAARIKRCFFFQYSSWNYLYAGKFPTSQNNIKNSQNRIYENNRQIMRDSIVPMPESIRAYNHFLRLGNQHYVNAESADAIFSVDDHIPQQITLIQG